MRWDQEPPYPADEDELAEYTNRLVGALESACADRLVAVLLCGSWARAEPEPPRSDVDLFVVVREVDEQTLESLAGAWSRANLGAANVVGLDEVRGLPRSGQEMVTANARVLWGVNPFSGPTRADFAADLSTAADSLARDARILLLYSWLTPEERLQTVREMTCAKWGLRWAAKCLVAYRTGTFPPNAAAAERALGEQPEGPLIASLLGSVPADGEGQDELAKSINRLARTWLLELAADPELRAG